VAKIGRSQRARDRSRQQGQRGRRKPTQSWPDAGLGFRLAPQDHFHGPGPNRVVELPTSRHVSHIWTATAGPAPAHPSLPVAPTKKPRLSVAPCWIGFGCGACLSLRPGARCAPGYGGALANLQARRTTALALAGQRLSACDNPPALCWAPIKCTAAPSGCAPR